MHRKNQGDLPGMTAKNFEIKFEWQKNAPRDSHFKEWEKLEILFSITRNDFAGIKFKSLLKSLFEQC